MRSTQVNGTKLICALLLFCFVQTVGLGTSKSEASAPIPFSFVVQATLTPAPTKGKINGKIAFTSTRHNQGLNIWTTNPDGSNPTRLTSNKARGDALPPFTPVYDEAPTWSSDGGKIAFWSNRDNKSAVYVMNADGGNVRLLVDDSVIPEVRPRAWSPDGTKLAVVGGHPINVDSTKAYLDIYVINADGSNPVQLTKDSRINDGATWSPDGKQIAFGSTRDDGRSQIYVTNADGSNQHNVSNFTDPNREFDDGAPSWSPDGTKIVFAGLRPDNNRFGASERIYVMNPDGSNVTPLTNESSNQYDISYSGPKWSPDGTKIVFTRKLSDPFNDIDLAAGIFVMNADGSNMTDISNIDPAEFGDFQPDWQPLLSPSNEPPPSILGFSSSSYSAFEDSGSIPITVTRTGNLNQAVSCQYATEDGTATVRRNYAPASGTLRFAPGETEKIIAIPLTDIGFAQGRLFFSLSLFNNDGNATFIGGLKRATITVLDRDDGKGTRATNPIDDTRAFVRQHYVDFLDREPDPDGLVFWTNEIESCGTNQQCREAKRINVSAAFFLSIEFQETGYFIYRFRVLNPVNFRDFSFHGIMRDMQEVGRGVVIGQPGWQEKLEANKLAFIQRYYDDDRLALSFGRTDEEFVDLLFKYVQTYGGVTLPQAKRDALVAGLKSGTETRPTVFRKVADDEQFKAALFKQAFVLTQYYGYLRRDPDDAGYNFWLNKLNQFNGNYINAEMVKAFITSTEYRSRFGQP